MSLATKFNLRSLTARLMLFTVIFVLVAEVFVMIPSVSKQRVDWFHSRVEAAYLVSVALEGPRGQMISEEGANMLFETAGIRGVTTKRDERRTLILAPQIDPHGSQQIHRVDLEEKNWIALIANGFGAFFSTGDNLVQVTAPMGSAIDASMDIYVAQADLRHDLHTYARNILLLSLLISTLTAAFLFYVFNRVIVHPVRRLTGNIIAMEADPDRATLVHLPGDRKDEIGVAERSFATMQQRIHDMLGQRRRLATLGSGISKISHDLRNILASAQLMSDRLAKSEDPAVRKLTPRLIGAIDRAITLSRDTLSFAAMEEGTLDRSPVDLHALAEDVLEDTAALHIAPHNLVSDDLIVHADRTQLYRALFNLARNATEAMAPSDDAAPKPGALTIAAKLNGNLICIEITDTGPGLPDHARKDLFVPFKGSQKPGGSGLGLAIAAEIAKAHGGVLRLKQTGETGTTFELRLPVRN